MGKTEGGKVGRTATPSWAGPRDSTGAPALVTRCPAVAGLLLPSASHTGYALRGRHLCLISMEFQEFERRAHAMWEEIPIEYKDGIDGVVVKKEAEAHPDHPDYFTLGMCFTEPYPSGYMGPETTRSILSLYYGSFREVGKRNPEFDWEEELWETITHELRHHLEFLAEDDALEGLDYAMEQSYKRGQGETFDPWYYQYGLPLAPGVFRVEYDVYIESPWRGGELAEAGRAEFEWDRARWAVPVPGELGDIHYIWVDGLDSGGGWLQLVLVRERPLLDRVRRFFRKEELDLLESEAEPVRVGDAPESPGPLDGRPGRAAGGPPTESDPEEPLP